MVATMNAICERETTASGEVVKPAEWWAEHFRENVRRDWQVPWDVRERVADEDRVRVADSIAEFQRGESSEAVHYLAKSKEFSRAVGDSSFHAASILFVREENAHAALLLRFMRLANIAPQRNVFSDGVFRRLRAFSDLGWSSRVLIIAELIAQEYYPCLREATSHPALRRICDKIVCDEEAHIRFQVERIVRLEAARSGATVAARAAAQSMLMAGAACVVWLGHRRVLAVRLNFSRFFTRAMTRSRRAIAAMATLRKEMTANRATPDAG
jgi:hypothetical protein